MKYAILEAGGKQYVVREGETIEVDRLDSEVGDPVKWSDVLLLVEDSKTAIGTPYLGNVEVTGTIVDQIKGPKIRVFKFKPKSGYKRTIGHRQRYTRVAIERIGKKPSKPKAAGKKTSSGKKKEEAEKEPKADKSKKKTKEKDAS